MANNRIPFTNPESVKEQEAMQAAINNLLACACQIYNAMPPGATQEFQIPLRGPIITVDKPIQYGILTVHKATAKQVITGKV